MRPDFGIFEPMFQTAHGYLSLLNLGANDADQAVAAVRECCQRASNPFQEIGRLLADSNWRPHLVASVAVFALGFDSETVRLLWRRLDAGSWVTPQIGATLFAIDPGFLAQARSRLEAGCPVDTSDLISLSPAERHSAAGPAGAVHRSAKAAATLMC